MTKYLVEIDVTGCEDTPGVDDWVYNSNNLFLGTITQVTKVEPPLPTTPGSIVNADLDGVNEDFALLNFDRGIFWRAVNGEVIVFPVSAMKNITVKFDAGA